ncbi:hypothetical protein GFV16_10780 [Bacillus megaterium]|uniref:LPO_1073/Vpar_1526 family protein n=1 Tax=Priestia megaterium TaxID=1404 RepID=UPI001293AACA|nr:LPO_1073/Vpar_1526 family protein [Priestia megaterium]MQR86397.1 hypothetical protein [Priestia megaterium]
MLRNNKYEQSGGQNSINLQGENVHYHGLTYSDAKEIAQDVFEKNFRELSTEAGEIAKQRANEVLDEIMIKLEKIEEKALESFKDPDVQYQIFNVQKEYARNGDKNLAEMLTDLLVERVKESDRNLKQILLNESISVLPKLTSAQVNILTWIFLLRRVKNTQVESLGHLQNYFQQFYNPVPLESAETQLTANYLHLQYAGCGSVSLGEISLEKIFCEGYPHLFPTEVEVIPAISQLSPKVAAIAHLWNNTSMKSFELTSVGITIAHSNLCRLTNSNLDLSIWLN